jgi:hypothetical protein
MSTHQKHDDSNSRCWDRQSGALTFSPPQRDYEVGWIKLLINTLYFITIIAKELNKIYLSK